VGKNSLAFKSNSKGRGPFIISIEWLLIAEKSISVNKKFAFFGEKYHKSARLFSIIVYILSNFNEKDI
jgi:hypothetical protein